MIVNREELEAAERDATLYGTGVLLDGRRIDPARISLVPKPKPKAGKGWEEETDCTGRAAARFRRARQLHAGRRLPRGVAEGRDRFRRQQPIPFAGLQPRFRTSDPDAGLWLVKWGGDGPVREFMDWRGYYR